MKDYDDESGKYVNIFRSTRSEAYISSSLLLNSSDMILECRDIFFAMISLDPSRNIPHNSKSPVVFFRPVQSLLHLIKIQSMRTDRARQKILRRYTMSLFDQSRFVEYSTLNNQDLIS